MAKISTDAEINAVRLKEQGSDPATPASTYGKLYIKTDGVYFIDDAGVVTGPFGAGGRGATWWGRPRARTMRWRGSTDWRRSAWRRVHPRRRAQVICG